MSSTTTNYSVAIGQAALQQCTGNYNIAIGNKALHFTSNDTSGTVAIGYEAGTKSSATNCLYLGKESGKNNSISNYLAIGNNETHPIISGIMGADNSSSSIHLNANTINFGILSTSYESIPENDKSTQIWKDSNGYLLQGARSLISGDAEASLITENDHSKLISAKYVLKKIEDTKKYISQQKVMLNMKIFMLIII